MKVTREQPVAVFNPVVITLETEEEAELFTNVCGMNGSVANAACGKNGKKHDKTDNLLWKTYNALLKAMGAKL